MKPYLILILTAVLMAFGAGYFALDLQNPGMQTMAPDLETVNQVKRSVLTRLSPVAIVDMESIYSHPKQKVLIDPSSSILEERKFLKNTSHRPSFKPCTPSTLKGLSRYPKEKIWVEYRCGWRKSLPSRFFLKSPFMDSNGYSFAFLAFATGKSKFKTPRWIFDHLSLFHVLELPTIKNETEYLPGVFSYINGLDGDALRGIKDKHELVLADEILLVRSGIAGFMFGAHYRIYLRRHIDALLRLTDYRISRYNPNRDCMLKDYNLCWGFSAKHAFKRAGQTTMVLFVGSVLLIALVVVLLLNKIKSQRREDETRRLVLRVLSHELRTPIASMLMQLEQLNRSQECLDEKGQEAYLRLSSDVFRLQRLTEKSRKYLSVQKGQGLIHLEEETIGSFNDYMMNLIDGFEDPVESLPPEKDFEARFDGHWLGICVKNLIENAITHGSAPVKVSWSKKGKTLEVAVSDEGNIFCRDLEQLTTAFFKREDSPGSGLGLHLVKTIVEEMGGQVVLKVQPTRFIIRIKEKR